MRARTKKMKPRIMFAVVDKRTGILIDWHGDKPWLCFPETHRIARVRVTEIVTQARKGRGK